MPVKSKAVLITGACRRLGFAFARQSLRMGYSVIAHYRSTALTLKKWLDNNSKFKKCVYFIKADLADNPGKLIDQARSLPVSICGLVNNASIFSKGDLTDNRHFNNILYINSLVPLMLALRFFKTVGKGWIINITDSNIAPSSIPYQNYRISKRILTDLTCQLSLLMAPEVRVNAIAPGAILPAKGKSRVDFSKLKKSIPLQRTGSLASLIKAYEYLIENEYVTGQILYIDGGRHLLD